MPVTGGILNLELFSENFRKVLCWKHYKYMYKEMSVFFSGFTGNEPYRRTNKSPKNHFTVHAIFFKEISTSSLVLELWEQTLIFVNLSIQKYNQ